MINIKRIPQRYKDERRWVGVKANVNTPVVVNGTNVLTDTGHKMASCNSWMDFESMRRLQIKGKRTLIEAIGFVSTNTNELMIDLDNALTEPDSFGVRHIQSWAQAIVWKADELGLYVEFSKSGTGLHIYGKYVANSVPLPKTITIDNPDAVSDKKTQIEFKKSKGKGVNAGGIVFHMTGWNGQGEPNDRIADLVFWINDRYGSKSKAVTTSSKSMMKSDIRLIDYKDEIEWLDVKKKIDPHLLPVKSALEHLDCDDYETWIRVGQGLKHSEAKGAKLLWGWWSSKGIAWHDGFKDPDETWDSFDNTELVEPYTTYGILKEAREAGWDPVKLILKRIDKFSMAKNHAGLKVRFKNVVSLCAILTPDETKQVKPVKIKKAYNDVIDDVLKLNEKFRLDSVDVFKKEVKRELTQFREAINVINMEDRTATGTAHSDYTKIVIASTEVSGHRMITCLGNSFTPKPPFWKPTTRIDVKKLLLSTPGCDGEKNCTLGSHYDAITKNIIEMSVDDTFFDDVTPGIATPEGQLYTVTENGIDVRPLTLDDRHSSHLPWNIKEVYYDEADMWSDETWKHMPNIHKVLSHAFANDMEQIKPYQEFHGAMLTGIAHLYQKMLAKVGQTRGGKNAINAVNKILVGPSKHSSIALNSFDKPNYVVSMVGTLVNYAGDLKHNRKLPWDDIKALIGLDGVEVKTLYKDIVTTVISSAQVLDMNNMPTQVGDVAMLERMLFMDFGETVPEQDRDSLLPNKVRDSGELEYYAHWLLQGAVRLLQQGQYTYTASHYRLRGQWSENVNSATRYLRTGINFIRTDTARKFIPRDVFLGMYHDWLDRSDQKTSEETVVQNIEFWAAVTQQGVLHKHVDLRARGGKYYKNAIVGVEITDIGKLARSRYLDKKKKGIAKKEFEG